jgi:large subunit ribosomal protein L18
MKIISRNSLRKNRHLRFKTRLKGDATKPRVSIYKSLQHSYIQLIDDVKGQTVASVSDFELKGKDKALKPLLKSEILAQLLAAKAKKLGIKKVVFDKSGYPYKGIVEKIAQALRDSGLKL